MLQLWLPIVLSAVAVFIVSSIIHTLLPWHKGDYAPLPNEERVLDALRPFAIPPGDYFAPRPTSRADLGSPEFAERRSKGPVVIMTVMQSGPVKMGGTLVQWFVYLLVVSTLAGHVACAVLRNGATTHDVFHTTALVAFAAYALALWQIAIWYRRAWGTTIRSTIDGLIYGMITGALFAWLWPK